MRKTNRAHRRVRREEQKQLPGFGGLNQIAQSSPTISGAAASVGEEKARQMAIVQDQMRGERGLPCNGCGERGANNCFPDDKLMARPYCDECYCRAQGF